MEEDLNQLVASNKQTIFSNRVHWARLFLLFGIVLLGLPDAAKSDDEFPQEMQGFWGDSKETCRTLRTEGPVFVGGDGVWLKITKIDVLGTTQGRLLQETKPMMVNMEPAKYSALVQTLTDQTLIDLTLSLDGRLFETIAGARASSIYLRC